MSYSQGDEESHILRLVPAKGRFLDIGAWHAKELSNTRALYERGWRGVMVEPSPEPFLDLLRAYGEDPDMTLICGAIGQDHSLTRFHVTADALTTSSEKNYELWKQLGGFYGSFYAPVITVDDIFAKFGAFDFVSIDAEGTSVDIFLALLATGMRPSCICVEHDRRTAEIMPAAEKAGYRMRFSSPENVVLAR